MKSKINSVRKKGAAVRVQRVVRRQVTLRGWICPAFIWDHNDPPRMFLPTLTKTRATACDKECIIIVRWKSPNAADQPRLADRDNPMKP